MQHKSFTISALLSSKVMGMLALVLLVVAVEFSIGEANSWFLLGLNLLEWTNPVQTQQIGQASMLNAEVILGTLNGLAELVLMLLNR
ncbi:hypothetical protein [Shewanella acanthi]|uniref:hypothetical protein n=1 Tax=Shewanella acanthi TaxID=2864212 RepID=UPI001C657A26|nr:hypothetical protein [Shewanella acanthi]QYJ78168.1 hypothetical protein K0H61_13770 [Shewanella acanthi]